MCVYFTVQFIIKSLLIILIFTAVLFYSVQIKACNYFAIGVICNAVVVRSTTYPKV